MDSFTDHIDRNHRRSWESSYQLRYVRIHQGVEHELDTDTVDRSIDLAVTSLHWDLEDAESYGEGRYQLVLVDTCEYGGGEIERRTVHVVQYQLALEV